MVVRQSCKLKVSGSIPDGGKATPFIIFKLFAGVASINFFFGFLWGLLASWPQRHNMTMNGNVNDTGLIGYLWCCAGIFMLFAAVHELINAKLPFPFMVNNHF